MYNIVTFTRAYKATTTRCMNLTTTCMSQMCNMNVPLQRNEPDRYNMRDLRAGVPVPTRLLRSHITEPRSIVPYSSKSGSIDVERKQPQLRLPHMWPCVHNTARAREPSARLAWSYAERLCRYFNQPVPQPLEPPTHPRLPTHSRLKIRTTSISRRAHIMDLNKPSQKLLPRLTLPNTCTS